MKKTVLLLFLLFISSPVHAFSPAIQGVLGVGTVVVPLLNENFDGATSCESGGVTTCNNTWQKGALTTNNFQGTGLQGTYGFLASASTKEEIWRAFTGADSVYVAFAFHLTTHNAAQEFFYITFTEWADVACILTTDTNEGTVFVTSAGGTPSSDFTLTLDVMYYIKVLAVKGTGEPSTNASCTSWTSTDGTTWTNQKSSTDGTWTSQPTEAGFNHTAADTSVWTVDSVRVSINDINY